MDLDIGEDKKVKKTYSTRHSLVVTDPTTTRALTSLTRGERTGSRAFLWVWPYVLDTSKTWTYKTYFPLSSWRIILGHIMRFVCVHYPNLTG
jgi:hypothetical protein